MSKKYYEEHKEELKEYYRLYRLKNKEKIKLKMKEYYLKNEDVLRERAMKKDKIKEKMGNIMIITGETFKLAVIAENNGYDYLIKPYGKKSKCICYNIRHIVSLYTVNENRIKGKMVYINDLNGNFIEFSDFLKLT